MYSKTGFGTRVVVSVGTCSIIGASVALGTAAAQAALNGKPTWGIAGSLAVNLLLDVLGAAAGQAIEGRASEIGLGKGASLGGALTKGFRWSAGVFYGFIGLKVSTHADRAFGNP